MLNVVMLSVVTPSVVAPLFLAKQTKLILEMESRQAITITIISSLV
jgi:hypothetical protein